MISFDISKEDDALVMQIVHRATGENPTDYSIDPVGLSMDLIATHCNGNPLRLKDLLEGNKQDFFHDLFGIVHNLDRRTGKLKNFFHPRFSV